jgi:hypothetical protein
MTTIRYTVLSADLLNLGWTEAEVLHYAAILEAKLNGAYPDTEVAVAVVDRVSGQSPVQVCADEDGPDPIAVGEHVREIANAVFDMVIS